MSQQDTPRVEDETPRRSFWKNPMVRNAWMVTVLLCGLFCLTSSLLLWAYPAVFPTLTDRMKSVVDDRTQDKFTALTASLNKQTSWVTTPITTVTVLQSDDSTAMSTFAPVTDSVTKGHSCFTRHRITGDMVELVFVVEVSRAHVAGNQSGIIVYFTLPAVVKCTAKGVPIAGNVNCVTVGNTNTDTLYATNKCIAQTGALAASNDKSAQVRFDIGYSSSALPNLVTLTGNLTYQTL